jgi:general secretion pathway protein A
MYKDHFGLAELPFSISPDPRFLYLTTQHREALAKAQYIVEQKGGLAVIYGDVGHGKTTVARRLHQIFRENPDINVALLITPDLKTDSALLRSVMAEFGVAPRRSHALSLAAFQDYAVNAYSENKTLVLMIDEAQQMTPKMMELIRVFLNFETDTEKFIQVLLFGQNELATGLDKNPAIKSRVAMFGALTNLTRQDMEAMIDYRWKAGGGNKHPFSTEALDTMYELTKGRPRDVNKLANESLIRAFVTEKNEVSTDMVRAAAKELRLDVAPPAAKPKPKNKIEKKEKVKA